MIGRLFRRLGTLTLVAVAVAVVVGFGVHDAQTSALGGEQTLPARAHGYLGVYLPSMPSSSTGLASFGAQTGKAPNVAVYYSGWQEPFQSRFARQLAARKVTPLVQIDPAGISLSAITHGQYNDYLAAYAQSVRSFGHPVIISFGHEMNGNWYSWGNGRTSAADFVAAWRHIVKVFRSWGAYNVTWLWTVNSLAGGPGPAVAPSAWWPGASYVTWVGIDGYYYYPDESFSSLFGRTISAVRGFTSDPVLITETGTDPASGQAATIARLFAGARSAGLLGVVYFDAKGYRDWRLTGHTAALTAFGKSAQGFG